MSKKNSLTNSVRMCQNRGNSKLFNAIWLLPLLLAVFTTGCQKDNAAGATPNANISSNLATVNNDVDGAPINLRTAGEFTILSETGISTTGVTSITGDIGVSPVAATGITGFGLIRAADNQWAHTPIVIGKVFASNYAPPTPAYMTTAIGDMKTAFTTANGRTYPAPIVAKYAGDISGRTLPPGLYKWGTGVLVSSAGVTLNGLADDVWVFQISQNLTVNNGATIHLTGGALAKNVFWVVSGKATLGTTVNFSGVILCKTLIAVNTGAKVTGRLLSQTAVTLIANTIKYQ